MNHQIINNIISEMKPHLNEIQLTQLSNCLRKNIQKDCNNPDEQTNIITLANKFIAAKRIEGCSEKTLKYYYSVIELMNSYLHSTPDKISTENLRDFLTVYQMERNTSKVTMDNMRRILSSYFSWLEEEDYILKSPMRRIHKIKVCLSVKDTYTDETMELMRDNCKTLRDIAIIDILASTGMRVGELVKLNIGDVNFKERECIVLGKGDKERIVYFDARTKLHLEKYIQSRTDNNPALFVSLRSPYERLHISGVEIRLKQLGKKLNITKVHPHKFRRTLATTAIDKGMPIEQLQKLLGHQKIDTTLQYAIVKQTNIKLAHQKFLG